MYKLFYFYPSLIPLMSLSYSINLEYVMHFQEGSLLIQPFFADFNIFFHILRSFFH